MRLKKLILLTLLFAIFICNITGCKNSLDTVSSELELTGDLKNGSSVSKTPLLDNDTQDLHATIDQLDSEYEESLALASSNFEICEINEAYAEKWLKIVDEYYEKLMDVSEGRLKQQLMKDQETWAEYASANIEAHFSFYESIYNGGTMAPVVASKYKYDLYREKALEVYDMFIWLEYSVEDIPLS